MSGDHPTPAQLQAVHQYLERAFPGHVRHTGWNCDAMAPIFEVAHETARHHIVVDVSFFRHWPDAAAGLRESELVEYMREAHAQARRFLGIGEAQTVRVRSAPL